jgi:preprotein translocase subunit SecG
MMVLIVLLTAALMLVCIILVFLVLIQLPKKEAGAGLAFGAGATDALFGAGSGTVLTKITKYFAGIFFALAIILSLLHRVQHGRGTAEFEQGVAKPLPSRPAPLPSLPASPTTNPPATNAAGTNVSAPAAPGISTNLPASTNK